MGRPLTRCNSLCSSPKVITDKKMMKCNVMVLENISKLLRKYKGKLNCLPLSETNNVKDSLKSCRIVVLEDINELARKYRGKLNLSMTSAKIKKRKDSPNRELQSRLANWELELSHMCLFDPLISVENRVDGDGPPNDFTYVNNSIPNQLTDASLDPSFLVGCECTLSCKQKSCPCPGNSNGVFAYDKSKRVLLPTGSPIYECNAKCNCTEDCRNRVLQKGLNSKVCIFRTADGRGWGLKTGQFIPTGKFVCEYVGEIITNEEAERRGKDYDAMQQTYLFDLDFDDKDAMFTIDAYKYGNVSRFINHSCDPNLHVYSVWVDTLDPRLPRIGLFAKRDIRTGEELTFDYMMISDKDGDKSLNIETSVTGDTTSIIGDTASITRDTTSLMGDTSLDGDTSLMSPGRRTSGFGKSPKAGKAYCACGAEKCRKYLF